jgi:hypothetical protein
MRQGPNPKRSRGRNNNNNGGGRRPNLPLRMQTFDSNGPDVRIRGTAFQVHEKYLQLARDANSSGDRIMAESYLQHAEHYYRIIAVAQEQQQQQNGGDPNRRYRPDGYGGQDYRAGNPGEEGGGEGGEEFPSDEQGGEGQGQRGDNYRHDGRPMEPRHQQDRRPQDDYRGQGEGQYRGERDQGDRGPGDRGPGDRGQDRNRHDGGYRGQDGGGPRRQGEGDYRGDRENRFRHADGLDRRNGEQHQRTNEQPPVDGYEGQPAEAAETEHLNHANGDGVAVDGVQVEGAVQARMDFDQPPPEAGGPAASDEVAAAAPRRGRPRRPRLTMSEPAEG